MQVVWISLSGVQVTVSPLGIVPADGHEGLLEESISAFRQAIALDPKFHEAHSNLLVAMHYSAGCDPQAVADEHRIWNRHHGEHH